MASQGKDLYRWKRLTKVKSASAVTKKPQHADDDIQSWLKKVEQASDEAAAITFGTGTVKGRYHEPNGRHTGILATMDALDDHNTAYNEAQDLLTQWMAEKCHFDDDDEDDDTYIHSRDKTTEEQNSQDLLTHWERLLDENDPGMLHMYSGPSSDAVYQDIESRDDDRTVRKILDGLLEKDMGEGAVKKDLGLNPNKKRKDPRVTMAARQQKVKENREKKELDRKQLLEGRRAERDAQVKARQIVKQEEKAREVQRQQEEMKVQQEMTHIRKQLQETRRREDDERRRKRLVEEEARLEMEREEVSKKVEEARTRVEDERRLQMKKDELSRRTVEMKAQQEAENLKCKHQHFQAWYQLVLDHRMNMGKSRALSDWRCLLRSWNAWRAYHRACQAERDNREAEIFVKESHRKNQAAFKHRRQHLLRKYFLAWQIWMRSQEESTRIEDSKTQTRSKMDAFLEAAASGHLWTERTSGSDEVPTERKVHSGRVSSVPSSVVSASSRSAPPSSMDALSSLSYHSRTQLRSTSSGKPPKPKHAWQVTRKHLKLTPDQIAHIGEGDQDRNELSLHLNLGSINDDHEPGEKKTGVPFKGNQFEHRYANQQKMLTEQKKQLDEQRRLIEDLQATQREQLFKMQIKTIQVGVGVTTGVRSGMNEGSSSASDRTTERTSDSDGASVPLSGLTTDRTTSSITSGNRTATQPTLLKGMEERAALRVQRKAEREDRVRQREEEKLTHLRAKEARKVTEEDEKKKTELKKRRETKRLERQKELEKKQKLEKIVEVNARADSHYRLSLMKYYGFKPWRNHIVASHQTWQVAVDHHRHVLLRLCLLPWHQHTEETKVEKCAAADAKYREILLQRSLNSWKRHGHYLSIQYQRARRHYVMHMKAKLFKAWQDYITNEKLREWKCQEISVEHNQRRIIGNVFKAWKRYPKMLKQEKAREQRREEMRKRVSTLLPDFGLC